MGHAARQRVCSDFGALHGISLDTQEVEMKLILAGLLTLTTMLGIAEGARAAPRGGASMSSMNCAQKCSAICRTKGPKCSDKCNRKCY